MLTHSNALWRIEYRSDLTRAKAPVIPVGFVLEARWSDDVRWLGMLFRKRLTPVELDTINIETWPEMQALEPFMNRLFDEVWDQDIDSDLTEVPMLGSDLIAKSYGMHSSLHFACDLPGVTLNNENPEDSFSVLYGKLLGLHVNLTPVMTAAVVPLPQRFPAAAMKPLRTDVEQVLRAA